jgi:SAM-dependent methyltransferase
VAPREFRTGHAAYSDKVSRRSEQASSFAAEADAYERGRPGYPAEAISWTLGPAERLVLDLGAGTGKLSRALTAAGHRVIAVEPLAPMRAQLVAAAPGADVRDGSAEAIRLPDAAVDAAVAGQAYHWFDPEPAHREIARVLRPGGVFAAIWNIRDASVPWVAELSRLLGTSASTSPPTPPGWPTPSAPAPR